MDGKLDGTSSLDEIAGLPENVLVTKTTMLPGDLLFEYNSADLRSSSKVGMQKIAMVMDLNPQLYCWIEGHTDLYGGDDFNYDLSLRRAESVKTFLVAMGMDPLKIRTKGLGKNHPIVALGTQEEQSINRRVEIKLRKTPPPVDGIVPPSVPVIVPPRAQPVAPTPEPEPAPPKAVPIRVKPMRALPVEEEIPEPPRPPCLWWRNPHRRKLPRWKRNCRHAPHRSGACATARPTDRGVTQSPRASAFTAARSSSDHADHGRRASCELENADRWKLPHRAMRVARSHVWHPAARSPPPPGLHCCREIHPLPTVCRRARAHDVFFDQPFQA